MLDKDNMISTIASEAVEKIPADEKDYRKCSFMCFILPQHTRADQYIANTEKDVYLLQSWPKYFRQTVVFL